MLDIEKIESGRLALVPEPIALKGLLQESLRLNQGYADRFKVHLALVGEPPDVTVRADRKRLMQAMTNFLSNAAKFSPPDGTVEVSARLEGDGVRVEVGDRGPGIPEKFRSRIFGRFAQADLADSRIKGGTGFGLSISKRLVEMMQGRVGFEDRAGGGTTFFLALPVMKAGAETADNAVRVLLTEYDSVTAEYLAMVLDKGGYHVDTAADAAASREPLAAGNTPRGWSAAGFRAARTRSASSRSCVRACTTRRSSCSSAGKMSRLRRPKPQAMASWTAWRRMTRARTSWRRSKSGSAVPRRSRGHRRHLGFVSFIVKDGEPN